MSHWKAVTVASLFFSLFASAQLASAQPSAPMRLDVDASQTAQRTVRVHVEVPADPGPLTLSYPSWSPGEHAPMGDAGLLTELHFAAGGRALPWRRDLVDSSTFHLVVPSTEHEVEATFTYILPSVASSHVASTEHLLVLRWQNVLLYRSDLQVQTTQVLASLKLPSGWQWSSALPAKSDRAGSIEFEPVTLETLVDSPVLSGDHMRKIQLTPGDPVSHELDVAAEREDDLPRPDVVPDHFPQLIEQARKLFGSEHYRSYHFLLAASDYAVHGGGVEHHESSDDRVGGKFFTDPGGATLRASFLPHEFTHSWDGKYRTPQDLYTLNYQQPMKTDLLWMYEGGTEYLATVLTARAGFWTPEQARGYLALMAADMDNATGRGWRPLQDTLDAVPLTMMDLFSGSSPEWTSWLRGMDYYKEGPLLWLEANAIIGQQTHGHRSLDDFYRAFFGGQGGVPTTKTYTRDDIFSALNQVAPYDWQGFFDARLQGLSTDACTAGFERSGWRLVYRESGNGLMTPETSPGRAGLYAIGLQPAADGTIVDVKQGSLAANAGLFPGMTIHFIEGQPWSPQRFFALLRDSRTATTQIRLDVEYAGVPKTVELDYHGGLRWPVLEPIPGAADLLTPLFRAR